MQPSPELIQVYISQVLVLMGLHGWLSASFSLGGTLIIFSIATEGLRGSAPNEKKELFIDFLFFCLIFLTIVMFKLPLLTMGEFNMDESYWIAGARTLTRDPRFWVSVDGTTSGPLLYVPLIITHFLFGYLNYGIEKILAFFLWSLIFFITYKTLQNFLVHNFARILILPLVFAFSFLTDNNSFGYFGSEITPILLISLAIYCYSKILACRDKEVAPFLIVAGITLGAVPFSKLQAVPIALTVAIFIFFSFICRESRKNLLIFCLAGIFPTMFVFIYLLTYGVFNDFWQTFILNNIAYTTKDMLGGAHPGMLKRIANFPAFISTIHDASFFIYTQSVSIVSLSVVIIGNHKKKLQAEQLKHLVLLTLFILASIYSIAKPGKEFNHYIFFLFVPLVLSSGYLFGMIDSFSHARQRVILLSLILAPVICLALLKIQPLSQQFQQLNHGMDKSRVAKLVMGIAQEGDKIALWGFGARYIAETGLTQGTREAMSYYQITKGPRQEYFRKRYIKDFEINKPKFFLDTVSPKDWFFRDRGEYGHEIFPQLKGIIDRSYTLKQDVDGVRIYVRQL